MPTCISRFSSVDLLTLSWFLLTTNTYRLPPSAATAPRGTDSTPIRSRELMRTFTLIFGSNSSLSLFTAQSNSPTLRVPCGTTCFGMISVFPIHVLLGSASQLIFTGSFASSAPISGLHRHGIQRSIRGRGNSSLPHLFFERRCFILNLLHAQRGLVGVQLHAPFKLLLRRSQPCHFRLCFRQCQVVRRQLVSCRGLLRNQPLQPLMILLKTVAFRLHLCKIPRNPCRLVCSPARFSGPQIILCLQELPLGLGEPRRRILHVQFQNHLPLLDALPFRRPHSIHKRIELRPHHVWRDGFNLSIAADRRHQIFPHRHHRRNLRHRLSPAKFNSRVRQRSRQRQVEQNPVSQPAIHIFLFCAVPLFALRETQGRIPLAQRFSYLSVACLTP